MYILQGDPTPLARARIGRSRMWDPQKEMKLVHGIYLRNQHAGQPIFEEPLLLKVTFYMPIPPSRRKKIKDFQPHHYKPDLSNLIKYLEDIGTGILYHDDCLIQACNAVKVYHHNPRTEFELFTIREHNEKNKE